MHNHYIINETVEFHPATSSLRKLDDHKNIVILNSPAGRCLLLLIRRQGEIVTQDDFMEEVWKKIGLMVSTNTYYQNISILRKGLKKIGFDDDIIVTISRMGLTLATDVRIERRQTEKAVEIDVTHLDIVGETTFKTTGDNSDSHVTSKNRQRINNTLKIFSLSVTYIVILLVALLTWNKFSKASYYENYIMTRGNGECKIFHYPWPISSEKAQSILKYTDKFTAQCNILPYIYVDSYPLLPRVSVIRCSSPITQSSNCVSDYFTEGNQ